MVNKWDHPGPGFFRAGHIGDHPGPGFVGGSHIGDHPGSVFFGGGWSWATHPCALWEVTTCCRLKSSDLIYPSLQLMTSMCSDGCPCQRVKDFTWKLILTWNSCSKIPSGWFSKTKWRSVRSLSFEWMFVTESTIASRSRGQIKENRSGRCQTSSCGVHGLHVLVHMVKYRHHRPSVSRLVALPTCSSPWSHGGHYVEQQGDHAPRTQDRPVFLPFSGWDCVVRVCDR
jgi:hypothetical protein